LQNFENVAQDIGTKMQTEPENVTTEVSLCCWFCSASVAKDLTRTLPISNLPKLVQLANPSLPREVSRAKPSASLLPMRSPTAETLPEDLEDL